MNFNNRHNIMALLSQTNCRIGLDNLANILIDFNTSKQKYNDNAWSVSSHRHSPIRYVIYGQSPNLSS